MMSLRVVCAAVVLQACVAASLSAGTVLYWEDSVRGTSSVPGGIALAGATATAATSEANFVSLLGSGSWDVVIYGIEGFTYSDAAAVGTAVTNYVTGGGHLIASTWKTSAGANGPDLLPLMDAAYASDNPSSITNDGSFFFNGVTGDVALSNGGYGTYAQSYTALAGGTAYGISGGGFGFIVGNGGRTILNAPLFPAFTDPAVGAQVIANEIGSFGASSSPEPASIMLFGAGLVAVLIRRRVTR